MATFTGPSLSWTLARDITPAVAFPAQTWEVHVAASAIQVESLTCDIRIAGNYDLSINGTVVASATVASNATNGVVFTLATPLVLTPGAHTFSLSCGTSVLWYARGNLDTAGQPGGTGERYLGWGQWQESGDFAAGELVFKVADGVLLSYVDHNNFSSGSFTAQTWTVTFDTDIVLDGVLKRFGTNTSLYTLEVDGVAVATTNYPGGGDQEVRALVPATPIALAAGAHTFSIRPTSSQRVAYRSGTTTAPSGDPHTTGWSVWAESTGNQVPARLFYRLDVASVDGELSLAGTVQPVVGAFTMNALSDDRTITLAGSARRPSAAFALATVAELALAGVVQPVVGAFDLETAKTLRLEGTAQRPVGAFVVDAIPSVALAGVLRPVEAIFTAYAEIPVTPAPEPAAGDAAVVAASAFGAVTMQGTQPVYTVSTAEIPRDRHRLTIDGIDFTYFRDVPTPELAYQTAEPLLYGPAAQELPQVAPCFEQLGVGELAPLRPGAVVEYHRVNAADVVTAVDYKGIIVALDTSGRTLRIECGGEAQGRAALRNRQMPIFANTNDLGQQIHDLIRDLGLPMLPHLGPVTGIEQRVTGGDGHLDRILSVVAMARTRAGKAWTVMPDALGVYRMTKKDLTTIHGTVFLDDSQTVGDLRRDIAEEPNRIYATGVTPGGQRVRFGVYPGLVQGKAAPYPMLDGSSFGEGTTNEDTDTSDGIRIMIGRLQMLGFMQLRDVPGGYDEDVTAAIEALQERAGLAETGVMNEATWAALYDLDVTGYSLEWSHIEPAAQTDEVRKWNRSGSGTILGLNDGYDASVLLVDRNIDVGPGFRRGQIREFAKTELVDAGEKNWVGTITFHTGALLAGDVAIGAAVTAADVMDARSLKPGMNMRLPQFDGGITVHVSAMDFPVDGPPRATVDTRGRDGVEVWEIIKRNRESRRDPGRLWHQEHRASSMVKDSIGVWDEVGGILGNDIDLEPGWNVIPVVAGQEGTVSRIRLIVQTTTTEGASVTIRGHEFACAVFGSKVTRGQLRELIGNPLAASPEATAEPDPDQVDPPEPDPEADDADPAPTVTPTRPWWEVKAIADELEDMGLLYAAGTHEEPCGYSPGRKSKGATRTGLHRNAAGFAYRVADDSEPVLHLAVWVWGERTLAGGRVMWNQLEAGA